MNRVREILDKVHVRYVLPKGAFMSKTVVTFIQKVGLIWLKGGLLLQLFKDTNVIVGLKLLTTSTNATTVLCAQGKRLNLVQKLIGMETDVATDTTKLLFRKKPEHWDINVVLLYISAK